MSSSRPLAGRYTRTGHHTAKKRWLELTRKAMVSLRNLDFILRLIGTH